MALTVITPRSALTHINEALCLPPTATVDGAFPQVIVQALRRAAHILAPCPRHELERAVSQSLKSLAADADQFAMRVTEMLDALLAYGDLLEMRMSVDDPWIVSALVIRPAPPAFVARKDGSMIILGVAGDELTALSRGANNRLVTHGVLRVLAPEGDEALRPYLAELGLLELSERTWLRLPSVESARHHRGVWTKRLAVAATVTSIEGLRVIDQQRSLAFYSGRWIEPHRSLNGMHVARRDQRYGAPLWCLVEFGDGVPRRLLDLTVHGGRERPCDLAWHLQLAIDADNETPQRMRVREGDGHVTFDLFSPLPSWAERKLASLGERTIPSRCLLSYAVPKPDADEAIRFLHDYLWIALEN